MSPLSIYDDFFVRTVNDWLMVEGELFVDHYMSHSGWMGGNYYFVSSYKQLSQLLLDALPGSVFTIPRSKQLPVRGIVDDELIQRSLDEIPDGEYYLVAKPGYYPTTITILEDNNFHDALREDLDKHRGRLVCVGRDIDLPAYWQTDTGDDVIIAHKPKIDPFHPLTTSS